VATVHYTGMESRSAVLLEVALFGEGRSITKIQDSVLAHGFLPKRRGVIRSSIDAALTRNFSKVDKKETVTLTQQGRAEADRLLQGYQKRIA
jgi:hypothetical protein